MVQDHGFNRMKLLDRHGAGAYPIKGPVHVLLNSTRPDWTEACVKLLNSHTKEPLVLTVLEGRTRWGDAEEALLGQSESEYAVYMEDRVMAGPGWLTRLLWAFADDERVGAAFPSAYGFGRVYSCRSLSELLAQSEAALADYGQWEEASLPGVPCMAVRAELIRELGGLDPDYVDFGCKLKDWAMRMQADGGGHIGARCKDAVVQLLRDADCSKNERDELRFIGKWGRNTRLQPALVSLLLMDYGEPEESAMLWQDASAQAYAPLELIYVGADAPKDRERMEAVSLWVGDRSRFAEAAAAAEGLAHGHFIVRMNAGSRYAGDYVEKSVAAICSGNRAIREART